MTAVTPVSTMPAIHALLPDEDPLRRTLHDELHARPPARVRLPALIVYVAVLNNAVTREQELSHLQRLAGQQRLDIHDLQANFLRLRLDGFSLKWERHTEFTRYSLVQSIPDSVFLSEVNPDLTTHWRFDPEWLASIPGQTFSAIELCMAHADIRQPDLYPRIQQWWDGHAPVVSFMGAGSFNTPHAPHSCAAATFRIREQGFERILVLAPDDTSDARAGRISRRLLELETYRLMALRGLPVAKAIGPILAESERALERITDKLNDQSESDDQLLQHLMALASQVEHLTAEHGYRFSATRAYDHLVQQRISELREAPIPGVQTIGDFMQLRMTPAMATVAACEKRLQSLSERIARTSALLRTKVDIAAESQNQLLLAKLTRGQELQLQLQTTVEGLSIAAISYYVISLLLYAVKAMKAGGLHIEPEMAVGLLMPLVIWIVWRTNKKIHQSVHASND